MKLRVNPLVLAAALGLLGPAALAEEEQGPVGLWQRATPPQESKGDRLGQRIEVVAVEDRVFIDDGLGMGLADSGTWTQLDDGGLLQVVAQGDTVLRREFRVDDDSLAVRTRVESADGRLDYEATFTRLG
jgi:hypothetical protein